MRKLLAVILAAAMTVSLAGCGGNADYRALWRHAELRHSR